MYAVSENGLLKGAELLFKANSSKSDYHGQMDGANFLKWVMKLIPSLLQKSVVVIDNAPYHTKIISFQNSVYFNLLYSG